MKICQVWKTPEQFSTQREQKNFDNNQDREMLAEPFLFRVAMVPVNQSR